MGCGKGRHSLTHFLVWRSEKFTELSYGQERLRDLDFQLEQGQHSVQAETQMLTFEVLSPRLNLGQPKAISVAPVCSKASAAIWLLSSTIASPPTQAIHLHRGTAVPDEFTTVYLWLLSRHLHRNTEVVLAKMKIWP